MVQHASTDDQVEALVQLGGVFDGQLTCYEIRQVVLPLQRLSVLETGRADINTNHAGVGMTERILCGLPRSTSGDEDIQIGAVFLVRPMQMVLGAIGILGLPCVTKTIQIIYWWWVGEPSIELAHRIGADVRFARPRLALKSFRPHGKTSSRLRLLYARI